MNEPDTRTLSALSPLCDWKNTLKSRNSSLLLLPGAHPDLFHRGGTANTTHNFQFYYVVVKYRLLEKKKRERERKELYA